MVVKYPEWVPCKKKFSRLGFSLTAKADGSSVVKSAGGANALAACSRFSDPAPDCRPGIRPCPKCGRQSMKDRGVCNVIQCMKCSTYWNWRTRETGRSYAELKAKSRKDGTLWEPGELSYNQNLEASDKSAFQALLKANGIKYDPNYKRGSG